MTAAEKRIEFAKLLSIITKGESWAVSPKCHNLAFLIPFTDDEPAAPADWRDQAVALGTGWEKQEIGNEKSVYKDQWRVKESGKVAYFGYLIGGRMANSDPLARCIAIDKFLADLGVGL